MNTSQPHPETASSHSYDYQWLIQTLFPVQQRNPQSSGDLPVLGAGWHALGSVLRRIAGSCFTVVCHGIRPGNGCAIRRQPPTVCAGKPSQVPGVCGYGHRRPTGRGVVGAAWGRLGGSVGASPLAGSLGSCAAHTVSSAPLGHYSTYQSEKHAVV